MRRSRQSRTSNLDLDVPGCLGNVDRLDTHLTIDNVRFAPCAYLVAQDIVVGTGAWASRHDTSKILSVAGAGASPTYGNATAIENTAAKYAIAKYHAASDTTWGQLSDKDYALEFVYTPVSDGSLALASTSSVGGNSNGFLCYSSSNRLIFRHGAAAGDIDINSLFIVENNSIAHAMVFGDRSEHCYIYVNGIFRASSDISARTNNLTQNNLQIGAWGGAIQHGGDLLLAAVWDLPTNPFPGVLKNRTYFDTIARERFAIVAGIQDRRQGAHTFTRATSAYLDKRIAPTTSRGLYLVSAGWPRVCERPDVNGKVVRRYLGEPQITNLCVQSETFETTWTPENLTSIATTGGFEVAAGKSARGLVGDATSAVHGVYQALTLPATNHCFSVWGSPDMTGAGGWIKIGTSTANTAAYFNLLTGAVGTVGAAITAYGSETWQGKWRVWVCFTGSAGAANMLIRAATSDGGETFTGDATNENIWVWGAQIEATAEYFPSSYIPTAAAAVARNKDELSYNVRLPIVGNINDLPQALTIGGTDYAPCAYLVADDVQADGTWTSRHAAKSLAFAGAGTNPTRQWDAVSRANKSIRYWASNYHTAADTTWGQITTGDAAFEAVLYVSGTTGVIFSTKAGGTAATAGILVYESAQLYVALADGSTQVLTGTGTGISGRYAHLFVGIDRNDKLYLFVNGVYAAVSADISGIAGDLTGTNTAIGAYTAGALPMSTEIALANLWDLPANPWPGAATNQAVMGSIARARFNQLFRYPSCRLDCEILHPNVDRQAAATFLDAGAGANDIMSLGVATTDVATSIASANAAAQWSMTASTTDIAAGVSRKLSVKARTDAASLSVDNASEATDAACEVPAGITRVFVGQKVDGTIQPTGLIGSVRLSRSDR